jgi:nicotinate-nucleotide adenylyltransferase
MGIKPRNCVVVFGGSFDPVHCGHVALVKHVAGLFQPHELRLLPAGKPWQKECLAADAMHRVKMLELAFDGELNVALVIDQQEIQRAQLGQASYSVETLQNLRHELGDDTAIIFVIGADQLMNLANWCDWQKLFDLAHVCAVARPGYCLDLADLPVAVKTTWNNRRAQIDQLKQSAAGKCFYCAEFAWPISASAIRQELKMGACANTKISAFGLVPPKVLDYIQQQHLYK